MNVNYAQLGGGQPGVALHALTNMPYMTYDSTKQSASEMIEVMREAEDKNWIMAGSCEHDPDHYNFVTGHVYTILGTVKLTGGPQLVKVRNPWGSEKYSGPFSDDSSKWTAAWKKEAGWVDADDGKFFMPVDVFKRAYTTYVTLMYQDWKTARKEVNETGKVHNFSFTASVSEDIYLTLDFQNERQIPAGCPKPDVFFNMYIDGGKPVAISTQTSYGVSKYTTTAGKKTKFVVYNWADASATSNFVLSAYSQHGSITWH